MSAGRWPSQSVPLPAAPHHRMNSCSVAGPEREERWEKRQQKEREGRDGWVGGRAGGDGVKKKEEIKKKKRKERTVPFTQSFPPHHKARHTALKTFKTHSSERREKRIDRDRKKEVGE